MKFQVAPERVNKEFNGMACLNRVKCILCQHRKYTENLTYPNRQ